MKTTTSLPHNSAPVQPPAPSLNVYRQAAWVFGTGSILVSTLAALIVCGALFHLAPPAQAMTVDPDVTPPLITDLHISVTHDSALITWTTDEPAVSELRYYSAGSEGEFQGSELLIQHSVLLGGLSSATAYVFGIVCTDGAGNRSTALVAEFITLDTQGAPVAQPDAYEVTDMGGPYLLKVLANDTDPNGDSLVVVAITEPQHGTAEIASDDAGIIYTPLTGFAGEDSFEYTVSDGHGNTASAPVTLFITLSDHPPVAVLGEDLTLPANTLCEARYYFDGSASYDPDGDELTYEWRVFPWNSDYKVIALQAGYEYVELPVGRYRVELTVSTTKNAVTLSSTAQQSVTVVPAPPVLVGMTPTAAYASGLEFELRIAGGCFLEGATVYWNGSPRPTTLVWESELAELVATIPASDLQTWVDIAVATVHVVNGDGQLSNPLGFSIVAETVGVADAAVVEAGDTATVSTAPTTEGEPGVTVTVENTDGGPITVLAATYETMPVGETAFRVDNGDFVDVQIIGADENDSATVLFYYPSDVTGGMENRTKLRYFNGTDWVAVLSSGGLPPAKDTTDNLDGTISGGRFTVVFDMTSTPTILELSRTVFGMFESQPQIDAITGPDEPVALGNEISINVGFVALGSQAAVVVNFIWDDGTETVVLPQVAGSASASHTYAAPGVYGVTVQVIDGEGDMGEGRFEYVVIYDPNGGFVTGGGWINSPAGAFHPDLAEFAGVTGKASFGFVAKYLKGANVRTGNTEFQFKAGGLNFKSSTYEWLVVSGARAQYKGWGTINGEGNCGFILTAIDGQVNGGGGVDRFRIKIWDAATDVVVYDNQVGSGDNDELTDHTIIGGGSIVIHQPKK